MNPIATFAASSVIKIVAATAFVPFTSDDHALFSGITSANPLIGTYEDLTIIIDGDVISILNEEGEETVRSFSAHPVVVA